MTSPWIEHVKRYQAEHGCSYKDALKGAKASYKRGGYAVMSMSRPRGRIGMQVRGGDALHAGYPVMGGQGVRHRKRKMRGGVRAGPKYVESTSWGRLGGDVLHGGDFASTLGNIVSIGSKILPLFL